MSNESLVDLYRQGVTRMTCPKCGGGDTRELSFSLFLDEPGTAVHGHCFRATCRHWAVEPVGAKDLFTLPVAKPFEPTPLRKPYRRPYGAAGFGERRLVADESVVVWQLYDLSGRLTGHVTRDQNKIMRMYKEVPEPVYYWNGLPISGSLWIFEDPKSASMCPQAAVALLGTSLPSSLLEDIRPYKARIFVALDPGAEEQAATVHAKLRNAGHEAVFVPMPADFKDLTQAQQDAMLEAYV